MFGMGFTEILLIAVVAILFLGPDKLPNAMVQIAKFIKGAKSAVMEAKNAIDSEVKISELKEEALGYKSKLDQASAELQGFKNINPLNDIKDDITNSMNSPIEPKSEPKIEPKQDETIIKKKSSTDDDKGDK